MPPVAARNGAMMSVYQPDPGQNSTTVWPGFSPQNARLWAGWRHGSRARSAGARQAPATAAAMVVGFSGAALSPAFRGPQAASAAALRIAARRESVGDK